MTDETKTSTCNSRNRNAATTGGASAGVYFVALIGAAVYYVQQATTFWGAVFGVLKALVWPALLVYKRLEFLKM